MYSRESEVLSPGAKLAYLGLKKVLERTGTSQSITNSLNRVVTDVVSSLPQEAANDVIKKSFTACAEYLKSEEGLEKTEQISSAILDSFIKSFAKSAASRGIVVSDVYTRVGTHLVYGLTYYKFSGDCQNLIVMSGYVFGELLGFASMKTSVIIMCIKSMYETLTNEQPSCLVVQSESDPSVRTGPLVEFLTAVWQAVSAFFGIAREMPTSIVDFFYALRYGMFFANNTMNTVFQFFGSICSIVRYIYAWISDVCFGVKAYSRLLYQDNGIMKIWAKEVQEVTDPKNECLVMDNASWHSRLVSAYMVSKYFQQETCRAGTKDTPPFLLQTHKQLHLLYTKSLNLGITSSIRPEPTCIWVSGPPGLGKTYMKDAVIVKLLRSCGIRTTGNDIYTMNFSQKHWTGAENKAVVYYDDFGTIDSPEVIAEAVGQFMQLVSDARFSPPQAAVEDKGKPIAPYIVYCNSNEANPEYMCVRDKVAFHRRRHFCIEVVRSPEFVRAFNQDANLETEGAKNWVESNKTETNSTPHVLYFFRAPVGGARLSQNMTFETMLSQLVTKVVGRYDVEMAKFQRKVDLLSNFTTITTETPLVEVLSEIERRSNALSYDAETVRRLFSSAYSISTSYLKESSDVIKGWFNQITESSSQIPTVQDGVCECDVRMHVRCEFVDSKLVWRTGDELHGQEIKYECTSEACPLKTEEWKHRVQGAAARGAISQQLCKHLLAIIKGDEPAPVSTYVPAAEAQLTAEIEQLQTTVPKTEIPAVVRIGTIALSGLSAFYVTHKVMNYFNFPGIIPMMFGKKESPKIIGGGEEGVPATVPVVAPTIPAPRGSVVAELISSGDNHTSNAARSRGGIQKKTFVATAEGLTLETQYAQQLLPLLDKATGFLVLDGVDRSSQLPVKGFVMRVFCLKGQWIILPKHYYTKILRTDEYSLKFVDSRSTSFVEGVTLTHIRELNDSELMFAKLPIAVPAFKDMSRHFMSQAEFRRLTNKGFAYERDLGKAPVNHALNISVRREVAYNDVTGTFVLPMAFEYAWQAPGRCMTPIYSHFGSDKIIGFHVAGGDDSVSGSGRPIGIAEPMIHETIMDLDIVQDLSAQGPLEIPGFVEEANGKFRFNTNLVEVGFVEPRFSAHTPDKTSIVPSLIHKYLPPTTRPAPLKPADVAYKFSPMVVGCDKHGMPPKQFDPELLSRAKEALRQQYLSACKPVRMEVGVLSETDAILGLEGLDGYQAMDLGTSEGFPFTSYREAGRTSKRQLFDIDAERTSVGIDPRLINVMIAKEEMRSNGVIPATVFVDCLKDSRIPIAKYYQGKTRVFSISPVDFTIQFRQYFLDILAAQKVNRLDLEHAVGINVHSIEWTLLARRLISKGQSILCGDYSNFGPGLSSQVVHAVGEVWCEWYSWHEERQGIEETEIARRRTTRLCMFEEMRHSIHLAGNVLYQALCGSPSGTPATVNINNDVNKLYIYMAWFTCFADNPVMNNIISFRKHCSLFVYGDDLVCGVSDAVKDKFNNEFLQKFLADHGIKYTDETKSDTITKFVDFREAGFLKGTWIPHPTRQGIFTYGLAKSAVEDVANWCFTSVDPEAATRQACCDSLLLAYGQGPSYYMEHRERLINAWCGLLGVGNLSLYTYEEVDNMRFGWDQSCIPDLDLEDVLKKEKEWRDKNAKENELSFDLMDLMY